MNFLLNYINFQTNVVLGKVLTVKHVFLDNILLQNIDSTRKILNKFTYNLLKVIFFFHIKHGIKWYKNYLIHTRIYIIFAFFGCKTRVLG